MINTDYFLLCCFLMACTSFFTRASFIVMSGKFDLDDRVKQALRFLPAAAFPAIFTPAILYTRGSDPAVFNIPQIVAGIVAFAIAARTKNVYFTLVGGMGCLWVMKYFMGV